MIRFKKMLILNTIIVLIILLNPNISSVQISKNQIIYVDTNNTYGPWDGSLENPFMTIRDGIEASDQGYTIFILNGNYSENVIINISDIKIIGENKEKTRLTGSLVSAFEIHGNNIEISNLNISNIGDYGIYIRANYTTITDNIFYRNNEAILHSNYILKKNIVIENNNFIENSNAINGFFINNIIIKNNNFNHNINSIILFDNYNSQIINNSFSSNDNNIILAECNNSIIKNNTIISGKFNGISLLESDYNNISNNYISNNQMYGIYFWKSTKNNIFKNEIFQNIIGIFIEELSTDNSIVYNDLSSLNGIKIVNNSNKNKIKKNNIISSNGEEAYFINSNKNIWINNYWGEKLFFPKIISGEIYILNIRFKWINLDISPMKEPIKI